MDKVKKKLHIKKTWLQELKNMKFLSPTQEVVDTLSLVQTIYNNARYEDQSWAKT